MNSNLNEDTMLTVVDTEVRNGRTYWLCRCECGNKKWIRADSIKSGKQKSCGCLRQKTELKSKDITGKQYSMLTPIKYTGIGKGPNEVWLCECKCGNKIEVIKKNIYSTSHNSCGCAKKEQKIKASRQANKKLKETDLKEGTSINKISRTKPIKSNTSGVTGVSWNSKKEKWVAQIWFKGHLYYLGRFDNKNDAIKARKEAEKKYFKPILEKYK